MSSEKRACRLVWPPSGAHLVALAAALVGVACASLRPAPVDEPPTSPIRFVSYRVIHNGLDHLALEILYTYDGSQGDAGVFIGAISTVGGASTGFWGYRPDPLLAGTHRARVRLGLNSSAPLMHRTDGLRFSMYRGGAAEFHEVEVPFPKTWIRLPAWLAGHRRWGAGCGS